MPILSPDKRLLSHVLPQARMANNEWFLFWRTEKFRDERQKLQAIDERIAVERDKWQKKFLQTARLDFVRECSRTHCLCNCGHPGLQHHEMGKCKWCSVRLTKTGTKYGCPSFKMGHTEAWPLAGERNRKRFESMTRRGVIC